MILFLAGSFPHLLSIEKEKGLMKKIEKRKSEYHRLVSFYYPKTCKVVLSLKKERLDLVNKKKEKRKTRFG